MQVLPITTTLRDEWEDAIEDGHICPQEMTVLGRLIARADDGFRAGLAFMRTPDARRTERMGRDFEEVHGPIDFDTYQRTKKRHLHGNGDDAA